MILTALCAFVISAMKRLLLVHYGEIGLKKGNAPYFIAKLRDRIKIKLEKKFRLTFDVHHSLRRFLIELPEDFVEAEYSLILKKIFGIKSYKFVYEGDFDIAELGRQIWDNLPQSEAENFRVKVKRSMLLECSSIEAERELGAILLRSGLDLKVKLKGADLVIDVEFLNGHGYFSYHTYPGTGGLSANSQGKLISLISAGIDSPVASYQMMKRGARVIFAHFHGYPYTGRDEMEQVKELVEILSDFQFDTKLYMLPLGQVQKAISLVAEIPDKIRTVLYRRMMLRIAQEISRLEKANGLITGDCFGQVASQTPENMFAIDNAVHVPVFRPLIAYDKEDIIEVSEKIGTFGISKLPCKESCTMFAPEHPELRATVYDVERYEKLFDVDMWVKKVLTEAEIITF